MTVKVADGLDPNDILTKAYADNNDVIIKAYSETGKHLKCTLKDGELCTSQSKTSNLSYTFTISNITSDNVATISEAKIVSDIGITPPGAGSVEISGDAYEGDMVTLKAVPAYEYGFDAWLDKDGNPLSCEEETYTDARISSGNISVRFKENLILGGVFTVDDKGTTVRFTRGNLYCSGAEFYSGKCISISEAQWRLEQHQYDFADSWDGGRISHFLWCRDCMRSLDKYLYENNPSPADVFFTNSDSFTVDGFNANQCRTLTVNEWTYLFGDSDARNGKWRSGVTVCGKSNCIVLLPDNWEWGSNQDKQEYDRVEWKHMESAGAVCLPAAGRRHGNYGDTKVQDIGTGYYWSAFTQLKDGAKSLKFADVVDPKVTAERWWAQSIRLVKEETDN